MTPNPRSARRLHLITTRVSPLKVSQALAAVTLMYEQGGLRIAVKRTRIPQAREPGVPTSPRSRPCSATPPSIPQPGTSAPDQPRTPLSSSDLRSLTRR